MNKTIKTKVDVQRLRISELEPASYNPRLMTKDARRGLAESVERFGMLEAPVVNVRDGKMRVVGGHQRIAQLKADGFTHVDCVVVRFDDAAEMAANLALNNPAIQGMHDPAKITAGLDVIRAMLPKPNFMQFDAAAEKLRAQAARARASSGPKAADESVPTVDEEVDSKLDTIYALGEHRVYCGDFERGVALLLPEDYAHVIITDPPYNVGYTSGKHFRKDKLREPIEGDAQKPEEWTAFLDRMAKAALASASEGIYIFCAAQELHALQLAWERQKGVLHRWLVIAKDAHTLSTSDFHPQYELCLFGSRRDAEIDIPASGRSNVIPTARPSRNGLHPAQKPVELIRQLMDDATDVEDIVLDMFAGSGTVLAVAQDMARVCYACELAPAYVDVIRRRWAEQVNGVECDWKALTPVV